VSGTAPGSSAPRPLALVTGGCRRLGAAIGIALAGAGHDLAVHSGMDSDPDPDLIAALRAAGVEWRRYPADLADPAAVAALIPAVERDFGRAPSLLVNNAARFSHDTPDTATAEGLADHYAVNTIAPLLLAQALAARTGAGRATIVNILDQRIVEPNGDQLSYTLSKLALAEATTILARQFAPRLRVCAVAPGPTLSTPDYSDAQWRATAAALPLEALPKPEEIADAVLFLARSGAITGQVIFVDGGAHLRQYPRDFLYLDA
jgi:NAD(P)-dependent dehydrogenase (short-subunit alcohol dehydrogenase family)